MWTLNYSSKEGIGNKIQQKNKLLIKTYFRRRDKGKLINCSTQKMYITLNFDLLQKKSHNNRKNCSFREDYKIS